MNHFADSPSLGVDVPLEAAVHRGDVVGDQFFEEEVVRLREFEHEIVSHIVKMRAQCQLNNRSVFLLICNQSLGALSTNGNIRDDSGLQVVCE